MPLTAQEQRCVELSLPQLGDLYGGTWRFERNLDDGHDSEASPECLVANGTLDAAIEVKRLTGDSVLQAYREASISLERSLTPTCGGYYMLSPAVDLRLPIDGATRRLLKREIERVAPTLGPEEKGCVRIPRSAFVSMSRATGPGFVFCCHNSSNSFVGQVSSRITGAFLLVDEGMLEHTFATDEGLEQFQGAVAAACLRKAAGGDGRLDWFEEWQLTRSGDIEEDDPRGSDGVWVVSVTEAREMSSSVAEAVDMMLVKALRKFDHRRWASKHVIVFERADPICSEERVKQALSWADPDELRHIDLILFVEDGAISTVWQAPT